MPSLDKSTAGETRHVRIGRNKGGLEMIVGDLKTEPIGQSRWLSRCIKTAGNLHLVMAHLPSSQLSIALDARTDTYRNKYGQRDRAASMGYS